MDKDASTIRQEIEQTRERMGDTVEALGYKADVPSRVKENVQDRVEAVKGTIGDVVDNVKSAVSGAKDTASDAVGQGSRSGGNAFADTRDKVTQAVSQANDGIGNRLQNVDVSGNAKRAVGAVKENPIGLALAALAIGFLSGSVIPVSEMERKRLKPLRDKIVDQAQAATNDLVEAGKAVVVETAQSAVSTALGATQSHAHDVVDAAKSRAAQS